MTHITQDHIDTYTRDGTVHVAGAFNDWVAPLTEAVMTSIEAHRSGDSGYSGVKSVYQNAINRVEDYAGGMMILNIVPHHPIFTRWRDESPAAEMTAAIMQSDLSRYWLDATFLKDEPNASEGTPWHNDTCTWPFWGDQMVILWIALSDVGPEDGPLHTVAGSHQGDGRYYSSFYEPTDNPPPPYKPWEELLSMTTDPNRQLLTHCMSAGDCLFMHPSTVHSSHPRQSSATKPRLAFSTRWLGDDVIYKPDPLTEPLAAELKSDPRMVHGAPPPNEVIPAVWPR